tara:strand:- start:313 stop:840 length:528 start_codon:yes stop_codon:yes gene_type:complete
VKLIVIDNFFKDLNKVYNHVKSIETFDSKNYYNDPGLDTSKIEWPGYRSQQLHGKDEWLLKQFGESFREHLSGLIKGEFLLNMFSHLRLDKDNATDFIHVDLPHTYSMLVYLSPTNLQSGTNLYNNNEELINSIKFVQNRAVVFSSSYKHSAINNHGTNIENGRLTLNIFMDEKK